jgi:hypothetical protein
MIAKSTILDAAEQRVGQYYHVACDTGKTAVGFSGSAIRCVASGEWEMTYTSYQEQMSKQGAMCGAALRSCSILDNNKTIAWDHGRAMRKQDNCNMCTCNDGTSACTQKTCQTCTKAALVIKMNTKELMLYSSIYEKYVLDNNAPGRTFLLKCKDGFNHQAQPGSTYAPSRFYARCSADGTWTETVSNCVGKQQSCTDSNGKVVAHGGKLFKDCHSW